MNFLVCFFFLQITLVVDLSALYLFAFSKGPPYIPPFINTDRALMWWCDNEIIFEKHVRKKKRINKNK